LIPIEAKVTRHHDIAWHKLAFPCYRFIDNGFSFRLGQDRRWPIQPRIVPVYCMYDEILRQAYLFVFPEIRIAKVDNKLQKQEKGLMLNDMNQLRPIRIYTVNLRKVLS
jgi:hypothetical protein